MKRIAMTGDLILVRSILAVVGLFLLITTVASGQVQDFEGKTISTVSFEPPDQPLMPSALAAAQVLRSGARFRREDAASTIDKLFATGRYEDIVVDAQAAGNGVAVRIITTVQWFVGHVGVKGDVRQSPTPNELIEATHLVLGQPFKEGDLAEAETRVRRLLERNGLYQSKLQIETNDRPDIQQRDIQFVVATGSRARYGPPVITGDPKLSDDTIIHATGWRWPIIKKWRRVTELRTSGGISAILGKYQSDGRLTAEVLTDPPTYDPATRQVTSVIEAHGGPEIEVKAVGAKVSQRVLKRYVPIFAESAVNQDLLVLGATSLRDHFQSQGYFQATVDFEELPPDPDHQVIEYNVNLGQRYKLVHVELKGNKFFTTQDLRDRMFLLESGWIRERHGRFSDVFIDRDKQSISDLYKSNGFRDVSVTSAVQNDYKGKKNDVAVTLTVDEGVLWTVSKVSITGASALNLADLTTQLSSIEGQPYSDTSVALDRNLILTRYQKEGYSSASFQWRAQLDLEHHSAALEYHVDEGRHLIVRDVILTGIETTSPDVVERLMTVKSGDPLSQLNLSEIQRQLYQLGIFSRINLAVQDPDGSTDVKHVLFDFQESSRYTLAVGIGAELARIGGTTSDITQPEGSAGFSPRFSLDLGRQNLWGRGHAISLRGRVSSLEQLASFNYLAPRFNNVEGRNVTFTTQYQVSRDVRTFSSRRQEAAIQVSQKLSKPSNLLLRFAYRRVQASQIIIPRLLVPQLSQPIRIGILSGNYVQDRRDDPTNATRGVYNTLDVGLASSAFGSQRSFARVLARTASYHKLTRNLVFARETSLGAIAPFHIPSNVDPGDAIPLPERFYGGGSSSHRGFQENQAGPRDIGAPQTAASPGAAATGFPLGGSALFVNKSELRFPLLGDNISGVLFHDMGNIFDKVSNMSFRVHQHSDTDFNYMVHAVGLGVRYRTPVGPIRLDLAYSINPPRYQGFGGTTQDLLSCAGGSMLAACQTQGRRLSHIQFFFSIGQSF
ncbi:MAG: BamA/TamA family outer membrane protein [Acidobacteriota bacterium]